MTTLTKLSDYFEDAEETSRGARLLSEQSRDYRDNIQLTAEIRKALIARGQPPVVINRIAPKVEFLQGMELRTRTDPKAYPRTQKHDEAGDAVTDGIRYVLDNNEFDDMASAVFENMVVEGTGGISCEVEQRGDEIEISLKRFEWDRFFIDPHSRDKYGRDARYMGVVTWTDTDEVKALFPKVSEDDIDAAIGKGFAEAGGTHDDQPNQWWYDKNRQRVMLVDMCHKEAGIWQHAIFMKGLWLQESAPSVYVNEYNEPQNRFYPVSPKVKRNGDRYGFVEAWIDRQDVVNNSHSKSMHLLNHKQTFSKQGMLGDMLTDFKKQVVDPHGHVEFPASGEFGKDFGVMPTQQLIGPHFEMYQDASSEFDTAGANAALSGDAQGLSGKALDRLQSGGQIELAPLFNAHSFWKKMVYRGVWDRIKQFKQAEWWVRVTDDEDNLKYVGLNVPFTVGEQQVMNQTGLSLSQIREQFPEQIEGLHQQFPETAQIAAVENEVAQIDVDIILAEVPDVINLQSEQFDLLVKMYQANPNGIPWENVVEMSSLRHKDKILGKDLDPEQEAARAQAQEQQQIAQQMGVAGAEADIGAKNAKAALDAANAEGQSLENQKMVAEYPGLEIERKATTNKKVSDAELSRQKAIQTSVETAMIFESPDPSPQVNT